MPFWAWCLDEHPQHQATWRLCPKRCRGGFTAEPHFFAARRTHRNLLRICPPLGSRSRAKSLDLHPPVSQANKGN